MTIFQGSVSEVGLIDGSTWRGNNVAGVSTFRN